MCLIVLFYVVYPIAVCDSHEFPFSGSAKAGGGDTAVLRCCDWAARRDHKMAVVKCCGVRPYRTPRRLSWGTGCKPDIYIYMCVYIFMWVSCVWVSVASWQCCWGNIYEKVAENQEFHPCGNCDISEFVFVFKRVEKSTC